MKIRLIYILVIFVAGSCFFGCATVSEKKSRAEIKEVFQTSEDESIHDVATALESMSEAMTGTELTGQQIENLSKDLRNNEDAQTAVKKIADSFDRKNVSVKYSPSTGKRYSADMEYCPETGVKLLPVE